ncbi:hypothetical protein ZWY2020_037050 [Hordeum vulgare]|nr:hypothetical protein ZWY2020_037050 [Hordeum vulgare]
MHLASWLRRDGRFDKEEHYEWFKDFSHFRHLLAPLLSPSLLQVLEVGCGNSRIGDELLREGVARGITRVGVVVADMVDLPFESESFDLMIEKGTMNVLFVDSGDPWNPNPTTVDNVTKMRKSFYGSHTFVVDFSKHPSLHGVSSGKPLVMASIICSTSYKRFNVYQPPHDPHAWPPRQGHRPAHDPHQ